MNWLAKLYNDETPKTQMRKTVIKQQFLIQEPKETYVFLAGKRHTQRTSMRGKSFPKWHMCISTCGETLLEEVHRKILRRVRLNDVQIVK